LGGRQKSKETGGGGVKDGDGIMKDRKYKYLEVSRTKSGEKGGQAAMARFPDHLWGEP